MREYSQSFPETLALPLRTFWSLNRQIDRLRAEEEQRWLRLHSAVENPESVKKLNEALNAQIQSPVVFEKKFDSVQFKALSERFNGKVSGD